MNISSLNTSTIASSQTSGATQQNSGSRVATEAQTAGFDYYLNSSSTVTLTYASEDSDVFKAAYDKSMKTRVGPSLTADDSIKTIEQRLTKFQKSLSLSRPDLAEKDWDVTFKDGKLKVASDIAAEDKLVMEARLNKDQTLVHAVQAYMGAAKSYLETSELNSAYTGQNEFTGKTMLYNFKDVASQLDGKVNLKELISESWRMYANPNGGPATDPGQYRGSSSLEILASRLTSSPLSAN